MFSLGAAFQFEGISLKSAGRVSIQGRDFRLGEHFTAYVGPWFIYRSPTNPSAIGLQRDDKDEEMAFRFCDEQWHEIRLEEEVPTNYDLSSSYPALQRFILGQRGEISIDQIDFRPHDTIAIVTSRYRAIKQPGTSQPILLYTGSELPDIYSFQDSQWREWSPWLPASRLRPQRRKSPESFEPDISLEVPGVALHPDGDFDIGHVHYRQDEREPIIVHHDGWQISKSVGVEASLFFLHLYKGHRITYRFINRAWHRLVTWQPVGEQPIADTLWFRSSSVSMLPLLERYLHSEPIRCVCLTESGTWRINKQEGERELLIARDPQGNESKYICHNARWYQMRALQSPILREAPAEAVLPVRDEWHRFDRDVAKYWVNQRHPNFGPARGKGGSAFTCGELTCIAFHLDGQITVGNETYERDETFELDYYRTFLRRTPEGDFTIWRLPARTDSSAAWTTDRFCFRSGQWYRWVHCEKDPDGFPHGWWLKFTAWARPNGRRLLYWLDRRIFRE